MNWYWELLDPYEEIQETGCCESFSQCIEEAMSQAWRLESLSGKLRVYSSVTSDYSVILRVEYTG